MALPNFDYVQTDYSGYPAQYATFDVFLSLAMLEGGPIPVLEAMMENAVPVASRTGFCPDLIRHGENGFLFDVGAPSSVIAPLIEAAFAHKGDIRASVMPFTWNRFARNVHGLAEGREPDFTVAGEAVPLATAPMSQPASPLVPAWVAPVILEAGGLEPANAGAVAVLRRLAAARAFANGLGEQGPERLDGLFEALRRKPGGGRPLVILLEAAGPDDLLATPAAGQIASRPEIEPFLIVRTPTDATRTALERWAAATRRDGLFEIVREDEHSVRDALSAPVAVVRPGAEPTPEEMDAFTGALAGDATEPLEMGPEALHGGRIITLFSSGTAPSPTDAAPRVALDGGVLDVEAPAGAPAIVLHGIGARQKTLVRRAARRQAVVHRLAAPLDLVRISPQRLTPAAPDTKGARSRPVQAAVAPRDLTPAMLTVFLNRGGAGNPVVRAFADALGCELRYADAEAVETPGAAVVWGVLRGSDAVVEAARRDDRPFFYIDHAYVGRGHYLNYRITRNAYEAGSVRDCPDDRAVALGIELAPWRAGGRNIIVCPPTQYFMDAHGCPNWLGDTLSALRRATDRPVEIRGKPAAGEPSEPLASAFQRAHAIVTHSSNVAVEAVIAGVPVFVAPTSAAAPVGETDLARIELPRRPDRKPWLAHLAYSQFSFAEIADGTAWRILIENEGREILS